MTVAIRGGKNFLNTYFFLLLFRLKDKLRRKQEIKYQKELQESQNKDVTIFTDVELTSSKRKKRRKIHKKASALDQQEHEDKHEDTILVESNEKEVEESAMKLNEVNSDPADDGLRGDTLTSEADKETATQKPSKNITVTGHFGKRITFVHYCDIVENLHKKLRRKLALEFFMSERNKLIVELRREIEFEKRKEGLKKDVKYRISKILFPAAVQRLEAERAALLRHKARRPRPDIHKIVIQESSTSRNLKSKELSKPKITWSPFEGQLNNAVEIPAEYSMNSYPSRRDPMSIKDVVFSFHSREERQKHELETCEKTYAFLRSFVPQDLIELNIKPFYLVKNISVFGLNNSQFSSMSPVTFNCIQHSQTMSNALQTQEKKSLLLCISLGSSESKFHCTTIMKKDDNIRAIETFLMEAMKLMMDKPLATGLELVQRSDVPNSACMVKMGQGQLITIWCNIKLDFFEFLHKMKIYWLTSSLTGHELVQRPDVPNCVSKFQKRHSQLIIIFGYLKLDLLEFLCTMKTYEFTTSLMKQTSTTGLELVKWSDVPNSVGMVQTGRSKLIIFCCKIKVYSFEFLNEIKAYGLTSSLMKQMSTTRLELAKRSDVPTREIMVQMGRSKRITFGSDLRLDLFEFLDTMKNYKLSSFLMNEVIQVQKFSSATIEDSVLTESPPSITGVTENRSVLLNAFKACWMADTIDPWRGKYGIESALPRKKNAFEVAKQWVEIKKNIIDTNSALDKGKLINLPSVVKMVDLVSRKATIAFKKDSGETQISVDFSELIKYANKIVEQHGLAIKVSVILLSQSQQFIKIEIEKANQVTDKLFIPVSNETNFNSVNQARNFGKSIEPSQFKNLKKTNTHQNKVCGLDKRDISKLNRLGFRKDIDLDTRKVNDYEKPAPEGGNLLPQTSAAYRKTEEKVSYNSRTEKMIPKQKEQRLQNMCDKDKIKVIETRIALKRQALAESIKKIISTEATRKYIFRLHKQMLKNISSEQEVKQQSKLNIKILSMHNVSPRYAEKNELLKQKLQKDKTSESVRETSKRTAETVSINNENTLRSQNIDEALRQKDEHSKNTNIIDDLEQTHYAIRLCMFH